MDISIEINIFKENNQLIKIQLNNILILIFFYLKSSNRQPQNFMFKVFVYFC